MQSPYKKIIAVCGPTASGKSEAADSIAEVLGLTTLVVDSMQVYREIPTVTNQSRRRDALLRSIASVEEEWTVAKHRKVAREIIEESPERIFVVDAGTGMYLNAILLDMPMSPKVPAELREEAKGLIPEDSENPRREQRRKELDLAGASQTGSVWDGELRYSTEVIYVRPDRRDLDERIERRSRKIVEEGIQEVRDLINSGARVNPSVNDSIGVGELTAYLEDELSKEEAHRRIASRTRKLARRQMRWFDKLVRQIGDRTDRMEILERAESVNDIIETWR